MISSTSRTKSSLCLWEARFLGFDFFMGVVPLREEKARRNRSSGGRQEGYCLSSLFFGSVHTMRPPTLMPS
jgi:chloramphenicol 3-O-phosphotransferase